MPTTYPIIKGNQFFNTVLYSGNSAARTISGVGFQPDFNWTKPRNATGSHVLTDAVRGVTKFLESNSIGAEQTGSSGIQSWNSDGYDLGTGNDWNISGETFVSWNWRASNAAAVSNNAGSITSSVSASTTAGFSIVTYTGNQAIATVGHGLSAAPRMIIIKNRSTSDNNWMVYTEPTGASNYLRLNLTNASTSTSLWNNTAPTSTVFSLIADSDVNGIGANYVAYCWSEVPGFSKIGSYVGNGSSDGPFIYTGFRPAMIWTKPTSTTGPWNVLDDVRGPYNVNQPYLQQNANSAEATVDYVDFLSNGFKIRYNAASPNANGVTVLYMAFAEMPTKYANAR